MGNWPSARPTSARPRRAPGTRSVTWCARPARLFRAGPVGPPGAARGLLRERGGTVAPDSTGATPGPLAGGKERSDAHEGPAETRSGTPNRLRAAGRAVPAPGPVTRARAGTKDREPEGAGQGGRGLQRGSSARDRRPGLGAKGKVERARFGAQGFHSVTRGVAAWERSPRFGPALGRALNPNPVLPLNMQVRKQALVGYSKPKLSCQL